MQTTKFVFPTWTWLKRLIAIKIAQYCIANEQCGACERTRCASKQAIRLIEATIVVAGLVWPAAHFRALDLIVNNAECTNAGLAEWLFCRLKNGLFVSLCWDQPLRLGVCCALRAPQVSDDAHSLSLKIENTGKYHLFALLYESSRACYALHLFRKADDIDRYALHFCWTSVQPASWWPWLWKSQPLALVDHSVWICLYIWTWMRVCQNI